MNWDFTDLTVLGIGIIFASSVVAAAVGCFILIVRLFWHTPLPM